MSEPANYKVITPPNNLAEKVSWNKADSMAMLEKRAAQYMRVAEDDAKTHLIEDVELFDGTVRQLATARSVPTTELLKILRMANDIRTQAASFDFDDLGTIASAVCQFVDRAPDLAATRTDALIAFADAMKAVASHVDGGAPERRTKS